jgi:hypothetical protein
VSVSFCSCSRRSSHYRIVGDHWPTCVGRCQLNRADGHERGRDDRRVDGGGDLVLGVDPERDLDLSGPGLDAVDIADRQPEHADLIAGVEPVAVGEVGSQVNAILLPCCANQDQHAADQGNGERRGDQNLPATTHH